MTRVVIAFAAMLCSTTASAQPTGRWYVTGSASTLRVSADEVDPGGASTIGAGIGLRLTPVFSIEIEASRGLGELSRAYSGWFVSYAGPHASREEIERLAPTLRKDTRWEPRSSWSFHAMWRSNDPGRVGVAALAGLTRATYSNDVTFTILDIPAGVNRTEAEIHRSVPDQHGSRTQGGLTGGLLVPISVTRQLSVAPEVRFTYGSFGDEIYSVWRTGARLMWNFQP